MARRRVLYRWMTWLTLFAFAVACLNFNAGLALAAHDPAKTVLFQGQEQIGKSGLHKGLTTIVDAKMVTSIAAGFKYENKGGRWKVYFKDTYSDTADQSDGKDVAKFVFANRSVTFNVKGAPNKSPVAGGDTITYQDLFKDADVRFTLATDGVKDDIILKKLPASAPAFAFRLRLSGVTVQVEGKDVVFRDAITGKQAWTVTAPHMVDSAGAVSSKITLSVDPTQIKESDGSITETVAITITPDYTWLKDSARLYPVTIDPTTTVFPGLLGLEPFWEYWTQTFDDGSAINVNLASGNLVFRYTDMEFVGQGLPTVLVRAYNSRANLNAPLGYNWVHNYHHFVLENADGSVVYSDDDGTLALFSRNADGTYTAPPGVYRTLTKGTDGSGNTIFTMEEYRYHHVEVFDASGKILEARDNNGNRTLYTYTDNVLTSVTDPNGQITQFAIDTGDNGIATITDPAGQVYTYQRDTYGNLTAVTNPKNETVQMEYDAPNHWLTRIIDARGNAQATITYDAEGRVLSVTDAQGQLTEFGYDLVNDVTTLTNPRGDQWVYHFNDAGNMIKLIEPGNQTWNFTWDAQQNLTEKLDPRANQWSYTYDSKGNRLTETDPYLKTTQYEYDANNNLIKTTDPEGAWIQVTYDTNNNPTATTDSANSSTGATYDVNGNQTSYTDGNSNITQYDYDANGNLTSVTDPLGGVATYTYNASHNLTASRIESGGTVYSQTTYGYDALDRLVSITDANNQVTSQDFDANGNLVKINRPNGQWIDNAYDVNNRLTSLGFSGTVQHQYTYDANDNRTSMTQPGEPNPYQFTFDTENRQITETEPAGNKVDFAYDTASNVTGLTTTVGANAYSVSFGYDSANRITTITEQNTYQVSFTYGANDRLAGATLPSGITKSLTYDAANKVTEILHQTSGGTTLLRQAYQYDGDGNKTQVTDELNRTAAYVYDALNRLTSETDPATGERTAYQYDPAGNRTQKTVYNPDGSVKSTTSYTHNQANELTAVGGTTYTYDAAGNLTSDGQRQFIWDAQNRLTEVRDAGTGASIARFEYDGLGRRRAQHTATGSVFYHYAGDRVAYETDAAGTILRMYTYDAAGTPVSMSYQGATYFYHTNDRGDVLQISDASGQIVATYRYDAWGNLLEQMGTLASVNPYRYAGYRWDAATRLYFLKTRYYDPVVGRFISRDAVLGAPKNPQTLNVYAYVTNNPMRFVDPDGRFLFAIALAAPASVKIGAALLAAAAATHVWFSSRDKKRKRNSWQDNPNRRRGAEKREQTGSRERNVGHSKGEEHSRVAKGRGGRGPSRY